MFKKLYVNVNASKTGGNNGGMRNQADRHRGSGSNCLRLVDRSGRFANYGYRRNTENELGKA
jgi:hypothetical protein